MPTSRRWASLARDRWVSYPAGDAGLQRLRELIATPARGASGAGKSMVWEKFQRDHAQTCRRQSGKRPIVSAEMPPVPSRLSLYGELIRALNANVSPTMRLHELECTAIAMLMHAAPRMILIDEIPNLLSRSSREQRSALNALKYLANQLRVSIVAAGTHEALHVMGYDPQIASGFEQLELPVWTESEELRRFIAGYLKQLNVRRSAGATDKRFIEYLMELTDGVTGRIVDVLRRTAAQSVAAARSRVA